MQLNYSNEVDPASALCLHPTEARTQGGGLGPLTTHVAPPAGAHLKQGNAKGAWRHAVSVVPQAGTPVGYRGPEFEGWCFWQLVVVAHWRIGVTGTP